MSQNSTNRRSWVLQQRPSGAPSAEDFALREDAVPEPGPGEVVTRTIWLSIDPYMRGRLREQQTYAMAIQIGEVMTGETVGEVIASAAPGFAPGRRRGGRARLADALPHAGRPAGEAGSARRAAVGVSRRAGHAGGHRLSRHYRHLPAESRRDRGGLGGLRRGRLGGGAVGQAGRRARGRRRRRAGECLYVQDTLGFDDCVDHRSIDLRRELAACCPNGIDCYFENVGGAVQAAVFDLLNPFARVAMCGMVSQYNEAEFPPGPNLGFVVGKRVLIQGFIVSDKPEKLAEWRTLAAPWVADGSLAYREDVHEGLEQAPDALAGILGGQNFGKLLVRVGEDPR